MDSYAAREGDKVLLGSAAEADLRRRGEMSVSELVEAIGAPQSRVSAHLRCLAWCGYVRQARWGKLLLLDSGREGTGDPQAQRRNSRRE